MPDLAKKPVFARRFLIVFASVLILAAGVYGVMRLYRKLEPMRLAKRARTYFEKGDLNNAMLTLRQAMNIDTNNADCARLVAEICDKGGDPEAIGWRNRVVDLLPGSSEAVFECAETALHFGQPAVAEQALGKIQEHDKDTARYHAIFGKADLALSKFDPAVQHLRKALDLDAKNESRHLDYAVSLLERGLLADREAARASLEKLAATQKFEAPAVRALVNDSVANRDLAAAIRLARKLADKPDASFSDEITLLNVLRRSGSSELTPTLAALKTSVRGKPSQMPELLVWLNSNDRAREAIEWSDDFTAKEWADPKICAAVAVASLTLREWGRLEVIANIGTWGNLWPQLMDAVSFCGRPVPIYRPSQKVRNPGALEYVRCALLARALREQGRNGESSQQWAAAVAAAGGQPGSMAALARLVADWGWQDEFENLLREVMKTPKELEWAGHVLLNRFAQKRDTRGLLEVTGRILNANPTNDAALNNFAMFSLLLGQEIPRACEIARKLYEAHPREAKYVSTYAFSLYVLSHPEENPPLMRTLAPVQEAVRIMRTLAPDQLETPDGAAYYGIFLAATGEREEAARYLDLAKRAAFLPEEEELIRQARRKLE